MASRRKKRQASKVCLIVGEGPTEKAFCTYLGTCFSTRNNNFRFEADSSRGGGAIGVLGRAKSKIRRGTYSQCMLLLDTDVELPNISSKIRNVIVRKIKMSPCIEGMFLRILNEYKPSWDSNKCKKEFHKYLSEDKKCDFRNYERVFPKDMLIEMRDTVEELNLLLSFFEV